GTQDIKISLNDKNYEQISSDKTFKYFEGSDLICTKKTGILDDISYCFYKTGEGIKYDTDDSTNNSFVNDSSINQWAIGFLDDYFVLGTYTPSFFGFKSYDYENMTETGITLDSVPTSFYDGNKYKYVPYSNTNGFPQYDFTTGGTPLIYTDYVTGYSYYTREGVLYTNKVGSLGGSTGGGDNGNNNGGGFDYTNSQSNNNNTNSWGNVPSKTGIVGESIDYVTSYEQQSRLHSNDAKGDPVNLSKGEFTYDNTLMQYSSKGFPFEFKINYLSQGYYNGPIGNNFDYNYNQFLREGNSGTIYYYNGSLGVFEFAKTADGYEFNKAIKGELTETDGVFTLKLNNTKTLTFNSDKRLASISDNFGNTETFAYTGSGQLTKITDTNSREYNLSYHDHTRLKDITDFAGNKVEFIYFGSGETDGSEYDLKTIKMTNGAETREISFTYTIADTFENSHNIIKLIDSENNTYVENAYDTNDRVTSQMYGSGTIYYTYVLSEDGKRILENHVTDREQNQTIYKYDTNGNVIQKVVGTKIYNYTYNDNNYLSKEIKPLGNGYIYLYDTNNNLTEKRFKTDVNAENSEADLVTSFTYDQATNKPLTITMPNGLKTVLMYDTNGNLTSKKVTSPNHTPSGEGVDTEETYEYNSNGELVKKIDPKLNETSFEYINGNLTKIIKGTGTDAITTQYNYDTKGNITSIIDGEGNETLMTYDDFNLLNKITTPESIVSEYTYNN
ncbi:hypothetical protein EOM39_07235, partial [Candidatus Gracilibacteria bacterium]|nr:hypothetical protein [Candidatus Gracilibacteria bacterium]